MRVPPIFRQQLQRVIDHGWLEVFQREAKRINETTAQLLAIGSRESHLQNIKGDYRKGIAHGFGVMQVDVGTDPHFAATWSQANAEPSIVRGADVYAAKRQQISQGQGKQLRVRNSRTGQVFTFVGRAADADDLRRITTASYNCGLWAYYAFSNFTHIDSYTTGGDYGRDAYSRAIYFAVLLEEFESEPGALRREVERQGKYALNAHQELAGLAVTGDEPEMTERASLEPDVKPPAVSTVPPIGNFVVSPPADFTPASNAVAAPESQAAPSLPAQAQASAGGPTQEPVRVFLHSLKSGFDDLLATAGVSAAAVWGFFKDNPKLAVGVICAAILGVWFYRRKAKLDIDKAVIQSAADPLKNTVIPNKSAR